MSISVLKIEVNYLPTGTSAIGFVLSSAGLDNDTKLERFLAGEATLKMFQTSSDAGNIFSDGVLYGRNIGPNCEVKVLGHAVASDVHIAPALAINNIT